MDEFLEALRTQGETESSGQFTLDVRRALEKLEQYQFPDKYHYVLSLVASAVAGGATFLDVDTRPGALVLSYDGRPLELSELRDLYGSLFAQQTEGTAHLRELAVGLHAGGRVHPQRVVVSWDAQRQRGVHLSAKPGELLITPLHASPFGINLVNRVVMHTPTLQLGHPELEAVAFHARHSGILLRVNGREIAETLPGFTLGLNWRGFDCHHEHDAPFRAVLHVPEEPEKGSACWVVHGLTFPASEAELASFGHLRVYADGLTKDLSQSRLVNNEVKRDLAETVKQELWRGFVHIGHQLGHTGEPWRERLTGWLLDLVARKVPNALGKGDPPLAHHHWTPVWAAPWLPCAYGGKVSLENLLAQMSKPKAPTYLPVTEEPFPYEDPPFNVVLETPAMRAPLRRIFRKVVYEW